MPWAPKRPCSVSKSAGFATIGGRLLDGAAKLVIRQFFAALARKTGGAERRGLFARWFGGRA